jgi:hypothetical protein
MTIALGMLAQDGIVVAADSQITAGDWKFEQGKLYESLRSAGPWGDAASLVLTGAGDVGYLELAREFFYEASDPDVSLNEQFAMFRETFERLYTRHILPFHMFQPWERPGVDLVIACARQGRSAIWQSHHNTLIETHLFRAVGTGGRLAESILGRIIRLPFLGLAHSAVLAAYLIRLAKDNDAASGGSTSIACVRDDGITRRLSSQTCKQLDDLGEQYAYALAGC